MSDFYWSPVARRVFEIILKREGIAAGRAAIKVGEKSALRELAHAGFVTHDDHPTEKDKMGRTVSASYTTILGRAEYERLMQAADGLPSM